MSETTSVNSFDDLEIDKLIAENDKQEEEFVNEIVKTVDVEEEVEAQVIDKELDKKDEEEELDVENARKRLIGNKKKITDNYLEEIIKNFLMHFKKKIFVKSKTTGEIMELEVSWYEHNIKKIYTHKKSPLVVINFLDLLEFRKKILDKQSIAVIIYKLTNDAYRIRKIFTKCAKEIYEKHFKTEMENDHLCHDYYKKIQVGFSNFREKPTQLNMIRASYLSKFESVEGVISQYDEKPRIKTLESVWKCDLCEREYNQSGGKPPTKCLAKDCSSRSFTQDMEKSVNVDCIDIQLTQQFGGIQKNTTVSRYVRLVGSALVDFLLNNISPGQIVVIHGVIVLAEKTGRELSDNYSDIEMDAFSIEAKNDVNIFNYDERLLTIVTDYINESNIKQHVAKLKRSICAHLYGQEHIKFAVLLLLIGTNPKIRPDGTRMKGDINILVCGNSGLGKSDYGVFIQMVVPQSMKAGTKGSSTVAGLTTIVEQDKRTGINHISLGLLGLVNLRGCAILEEVNRREKKDLGEFANATDDNQEILVNKGGFHTTIRSICPIYATANSLDKNGNWDDSKTVSEQTKLDRFILSRMDLVFVVRMDKSQEYKQKLMKHIESEYDKSVFEKEYEAEIEGKSNVKRTEEILKEVEVSLRKNDFSGIYPIEYLRHERYFLRTIDSRLAINSEPYRYIERFWSDFTSNEALAELNDDYVSDAVLSNAGDIRKFYTTIKLAETIARLYRRRTVTLDDAKEACDLMAVSLASQIPKIGNIDLEEQNEYVKKMMEKNSVNKMANAIANEKKILYKNTYLTFTKQLKKFNEYLKSLGWEACKSCHGTGKVSEVVDIETKKIAIYQCTSCKGDTGFDKKFTYNDLENIIVDAKVMTKERCNTFFQHYLTKKFVTGKTEKVKINGFEELVTIFTLNIDLNSPDVIDSITKLAEVITEAVVQKIEKEEMVKAMNENKRKRLPPSFIKGDEVYEQDTF